MCRPQLAAHKAPPRVTLLRGWRQMCCAAERRRRRPSPGRCPRRVSERGRVRHRGACGAAAPVRSPTPLTVGPTAQMAGVLQRCVVDQARRLVADRAHVSGNAGFRHLQVGAAIPMPQADATGAKRLRAVLQVSWDATPPSPALSAAPCDAHCELPCSPSLLQALAAAVFAPPLSATVVAQRVTSARAAAASQSDVRAKVGCCASVCSVPCGVK